MMLEYKFDMLFDNKNKEWGMKERAANNRTLTLKPEEIEPLRACLLSEKNIISTTDIVNKTINGDVLKMLRYIPDNFADLIIIDPPYNLTKNFNGMKFNSRSDNSYDEYLSTWFPEVCKKLKPTGSLYMCGDWKCTSSLQRAKMSLNSSTVSGMTK